MHCIVCKHAAIVSKSDDYAVTNWWTV